MGCPEIEGWIEEIRDSAVALGGYGNPVSGNDYIAYACAVENPLLSFDPVPADHVRHVQFISAVNKQAAYTYLDFDYHNGSVAHGYDRYDTPAQNERVIKSFPFVMYPGEYIRLHFVGCGIGNNLEMFLFATDYPVEV